MTKAVSGKLELRSSSPEDLDAVSQSIIRFAGKETIILFNGPMGVGKTTLIKSLCKELGVIDNVSSPTFSIVNEYVTENGEQVFHFDFYRIKDEREAMDLGVDEYFYSGSKCFIEWASQIPTLIPEHFVEVNISLEGTDRVFHISIT
ncbi:MAG: tRNA (adenosine(37)-N6)-threonylcarbamoyltransferase complex ATPase subunit type 1 TsaE [Cytophagaceae bacterium]